MRSLQNNYISRESNVLWMKQQVAKKRVKRDFLKESQLQKNKKRDIPYLQEGESESARQHTLFNIFDDKRKIYLEHNQNNVLSQAQLKILQKQQKENRHQNNQNIQFNNYGNVAASPLQTDFTNGVGLVGSYENDLDQLNWNGILGDRSSSVTNHMLFYNRQKYEIPNDDYYLDQWYLHRSNKNKGVMDHNVEEAWSLGFTGRGIVVTILDDGLELTHPDLNPNYDPKASYDVNGQDNDPTPRYDDSDENRHGTRCAGEVAAVFNNSFCVVGIAYNARIGGIRMLDGDVTDAVEATSLSYNYQHIDIYSASWGPDDDGRTVDGPSTLTRKAFERGIKEGRNKLGSIFIWASGNGGKDSDSCNCDGYTNSIYTLSISSATERGNIPWYSEACSSTLATAYSSGATGERMIITTDLHHACTKTHTGTSASAPLAAGIAALTLEANPDLTWRDLQHIVVRTAKPVNLRAGDWKINGVGRKVSHSFGYGLLDAGAMVRLAQVWKSVPPQKRCRTVYSTSRKQIPYKNRLVLQLHTDGCAGNRETSVKYVEHVQSIMTLNATKRGDIQIYLSSPKGTKSTLLAKRIRDASHAGFREWAFMTTHNWGETAQGVWLLEIDNEGSKIAELTKWDLVMYGTDAPVGLYGAESSVAQRSVVGFYNDDFSNGTTKLIFSQSFIHILQILTFFFLLFT